MTTALSRSTSEYTEKHHILPRSFGLGGTKDKLNLVVLTGREHYICHLLLTKMSQGKNKSKMWYALWQVSNRLKTKVKMSSRQYAIARQQISQIHSNRVVSDLTRQRQSVAITGTHVGWHHSAESKKKISDAHMGRSKGPFTAEHRAKLSSTHSGENHQNYGLHHSNETKRRISEGLKKTYHVIKVSCLNCKTVTNIGNYTKHHGPNCKH